MAPNVDSRTVSTKMSSSKAIPSPHAVGQWAPLLVAMPLLLGGVLAGASLLKQKASPSDRSLHTSRFWLRRRLLGKDKQTVAQFMGAPRTATVTQPIGAGDLTDRPAYWHADTWYYALDSKRDGAMAVMFASGIVRRIEFIARWD